MDMVEAKKNQHKSWTMVAPGWGKYDPQMRTWAQPVTDRMIALAAIREGSRVLDIACGAGEPALTIAERVGPGGAVLATDFVEEMIGYARSKAQARALSNIEFRCVDGEVIDAMKNSFDAVTMRWGLMFMPDPGKCMHCAYTALKPGGKAVISVWTEAANNPFVTVPLGVLKRHMDVPTPPPGAPGIFALANPDRLRSIFAEAGFRDVAIEQVQIPMADFPTGAEYDVFIRELAGPVASLYAQLPAETQERVKKEIAQEAEARSSKPGRVYLHGITHVAVGTK
ncbi:methyltransferase type 11 [Sulfuricaulis limicola]|uniref:Methyltransferase type 11 n=2 Tax=Sulfuricaulis limicola TaxID=1620215 RepID=A0A1B4XFQ9_9GAMM|nr:methyltransferase type 11 [Sulfuricaulis limicola]